MAKISALHTNLGRLWSVFMPAELTLLYELFLWLFKTFMTLLGSKAHQIHLLPEPWLACNPSYWEANSWMVWGFGPFCVECWVTPASLHRLYPPAHKNWLDWHARQNQASKYSIWTGEAKLCSTWEGMWVTLAFRCSKSDLSTTLMRRFQSIQVLGLHISGLDVLVS